MRGLNPTMGKIFLALFLLPRKCVEQLKLNVDLYAVMEKCEFLTITNVAPNSPLRELEEKKVQQMRFKPST